MGEGTADTPETLPDLCIKRVPNRPVGRGADGRVAIHLWLRQGRRFDGDVVLRLSSAEAEVLHAQLCYVLEGQPTVRPSPRNPACRAAPQP